MRPRLIASDLDGTLVRTDETISPRTGATLARLASSGHRVVLVTGRPLRWLGPAYDHLPFRPWAVVANGAAVYDPDRGDLVHRVDLAPPVLAEVVDRIVAIEPQAVFAVEHDGGQVLWREPSFVVGGWEDHHGGVQVVSRAGLIATPATKLLVRPAAALVGFAGEGVAEEFNARVCAVLHGLGEATHSGSSGMIEISAAGVTKAYGLTWVAEYFGLPQADAFAFGDMPNDLPMLAWAGRGVAVANAHPSVLAAADEVTGHHDADGVADYLDRHLPAC